MRLDKYLALSGERSRSDATRAVRSGAVLVNSVVVRDPAAKVAPDDRVTLAAADVANAAEQYYLLNKPSGVLTAASDSRVQTVMDLMPETLRRRKVLPVGRLDKDTTGLLLLTNDGLLAHQLLHPKRHVWKRYAATVSGRLTEIDCQSFAKGMRLSDFEAKPAVLRILHADDAQSLGEVALCEGKFHQVKRMFLACGHEVLTLHRSHFGPLELPVDMAPGDYRPLDADEIAALKQCVAKQPLHSAQEGETDA